MMTRQPITLITLILAIIGVTSGYSTPPQKPLSAQQSSSSYNNRIITRQSFLQTTACLTFLGGNIQSANAKEIDPAVKGTKSDPEFQACLSKCVYDCTKPKGAEQRSRGECLPECKTKCAKTKEQSAGKIMDRM